MSLIFTLLFSVCLALAVLVGRLPTALAMVYLAASGVTFLVYALDKWAAQRDQRRTPERVLHLLGLLGGWPGALLAQNWLHHKSKKPAFQRVFWLTVVMNSGVLGWMVLNVKIPP